jgi:sugar (pentulose or hexulose) kinase
MGKLFVKWVLHGRKIYLFDLGSGGNKAYLYDLEGNCLASDFVPNSTCPLQVRWHKRRPLNWVRAVIERTQALLSDALPMLNYEHITMVGIAY